MDAATRAAVWHRADSRCEYCRLHQADDPLFTFHIEHIIARQHGGTDDPDNLALSCHACNLFKGPNLSGIDPLTGRLVALFHPRRHRWARHFRWDGPRVVG
jgi:5-methylcytosine-specific restriction endonuclease McrA